MKESPFKQRVEKLLAILEEEKIDAMIVTPSSDMKYLCGYSVNGDERFLAMIISNRCEPFIIANSLYESQVIETPVTEFCYWNDGDKPFEMLKQEFIERGIPVGQVAVNSAMPALFSLQLNGMFPDMKLVNGSPLVQRLRVYKDRSEMDAIISATQRAMTALRNCIGRGNYWLGKKEIDFLAEFSMEMTKLGLGNPGACVAVGANAATPHHCTGETEIQSGKCLLIDFGGDYKNYWSDMTRTFHFGKPSQKFVDVYNIVLEACLAGEAAAKAGNKLEDVDIAARSVIQKAGYGEYFIHRTGHGIGIDYHEGPSAGLGEKTLISSGMAFSCEPGIYLPGEFGVRIEDQILIDDTGKTIILHEAFPKELTIIE